VLGIIRERLEEASGVVSVGLIIGMAAERLLLEAAGIIKDESLLVTGVVLHERSLGPMGIVGEFSLGTSGIDCKRILSFCGKFTVRANGD
jgi:hypothetical protein